MSDTFGHLRTYRITLNELFGSTDDDGGSTKLMIRNDGTDETGSVRIRSAGNKISSHLVNSNGAKVLLDGEIEIGSMNHAAQIFSNSSVDTDMHIRSTNASSGIFLDPATKRVSVNGNIALNGGVVLSNEKDLVLYSSGSGTKDIVLDPRTKNDGGDVYVKGNVIVEEQQIEGTHSSNLTVVGKKDLVLTSTDGNVQLLLDSCNINALSDGHLSMMGSNGVTATASNGTLSLNSTTGHTTLNAGSNLTGEGEAVTLTSRNVNVGATVVSGGANLRLTRGNAFLGGANVHLKSHNGEIRMTGSKSAHIQSTGTGGVDVSSTSGNTVLSSGSHTVITSAGDLRTTSTDATIHASNVARVTSDGFCEMKSTASDARVSAHAALNMQSNANMTLNSAQGHLVASSTVGNLSTSGVNVHSEAGGGVAKLDLLNSGEARLVCNQDLLVKSLASDLVMESSTAAVRIDGHTDTTLKASNVASMRSDALVALSGANASITATSGNVVLDGAQFVNIQTAAGTVNLSSNTGNLESTAKNVTLFAHDAQQAETVGLTLLSGGDATLSADRNILLTPNGDLGATCANVSAVASGDATLQGSNVAALRSSTLAMVKSAATAAVEALDVTVVGQDSVTMDVSAGTFSVNSKLLQLDAYDGSTSVASMEMDDSGDINIAGEGDVTVVSTAGNIVTTAAANVVVSGANIRQHATAHMVLESANTGISATGNVDVTGADVNVVASGGTQMRATGDALVSAANAVLSSSTLTTVESDTAVRVQAKAGDAVILASQDVHVTPSRHLVVSASNANTLAANVHMNASAAGKSAEMSMIGSSGTARLDAENVLFTATKDITGTSTGNVAMQASTDLTLESTSGTTLLHSGNQCVVSSVSGTQIGSTANVDLTGANVSIHPTGDVVMRTSVGDILAATGSNVRLRASVSDLAAAESATSTVLGLSSDGDASLSGTRHAALTAHNGNVSVTASAGDTTVHSANVSKVSSDGDVLISSVNATQIASSSLTMQAEGDVSVNSANGGNVVTYAIGGGVLQMLSDTDAHLQAQEMVEISSISTSVTVAAATDVTMQGGSNVKMDATSVLVGSGAGVEITATTDDLTLVASSGDSQLSSRDVDVTASRNLVASGVDATLVGSNVAALRSSALVVVQSDKETEVDAAGGNVSVTASQNISLTPSLDLVTTASSGNTRTNARNIHMDAVNDVGTSAANLKIQRSGRATLQASKILMNVASAGGNIMMNVPSGNIETSAQVTKVQSNQLTLGSTQLNTVKSSAGNVDIVASAGAVNISAATCTATTAGKMLQTSGDDMTIEALNGSNVNIESHDINLISANLISFTTGGGTIDMGSTTSIDADYLELNATNTLTSNTGSHTTLIVGGNLLHDVAGDADTIAVGNVLLNSGTANVTLHQTGLIHMETAGDLEHSVGGNIGTTATDFTAHASNVASLKSDSLVSIQSLDTTLTASNTITVEPSKNLLLKSTDGDVTQIASAGNSTTQAKTVSVQSVTTGSAVAAELVLQPSGYAELSSVGNVDISAASSKVTASGPLYLASTTGATTLSGFSATSIESDGRVTIDSDLGTDIVSNANVAINPLGDLVLGASGNLVGTASAVTVTSTGATEFDAQAFTAQATAGGELSLSQDVSLLATSGSAGLSTAGAAMSLSHAGAMSLTPTGDLSVTVGGDVVQTSQDSTWTASNVAHLSATKRILVETPGGELNAVSNVMNLQSGTLTVGVSNMVVNTADLDVTASGGYRAVVNAMNVQSATTANVSVGGALTVSATSVGVDVGSAATLTADSLGITSAAGINATVTAGNLETSAVRTDLQSTADTRITAGNGMELSCAAGDAVLDAGSNVSVTSQAGDASLVANGGDVHSTSTSGNAVTTGTNVLLSSLQLDTDTGMTTTADAPHATLSLLDSGLASLVCASNVLLNPSGDLVGSVATGNLLTTSLNAEVTATQRAWMGGTLGAQVVSQAGSVIIGGQTDASLLATTGDATVSSGAGRAVVKSAAANLDMTTAGAMVARSARNIEMLSTGDSVTTAANTSTLATLDATITSANVTTIRSDDKCRVISVGDTTMSSSSLLADTVQDVSLTAGRHHVVTAVGNSTTTALNTMLSSSSSGTKMNLLSTGNVLVSSAKSMQLTAVAGDLVAQATSGNVVTSGGVDSTLSSANVTAVTSSGLVKMTGSSASIVATSELDISCEHLSMSASGNSVTEGAVVKVQSTSGLGSLVLPSAGGATLTTPSGDVELLPSGDLVARSTNGGNILAEGDTVTLTNTTTSLVVSSAGASITGAGDVTLNPTAGGISLLAGGATGDIVGRGARDTTIDSANATTVTSDAVVAIEAPTTSISGSAVNIQSTNTFAANATSESILESATKTVVRSGIDLLVGSTAGNVSVTAGGATTLTPTSDLTMTSTSGRVDLVSQTGTARVAGASNVAVLQLEPTGRAALSAGAGGLALRLPSAGDFSATASAGNALVGGLDATVSASNACVLKSDALLKLSGSAVEISSTTATLQASGNVTLEPSGDLVMGASNVVATSSGLVALASKQAGDPDSSIELHAGGDSILRASRDARILPSGDFVATAAGNILSTGVDATVSASNASVLRSDGTVRIQSSGGDTTLASSVDILASPSQDMRVSPGRHYLLTATGNTNNVGANVNLSSSSSPGTKLHLLASGDTQLYSNRHMNISATLGDVVASASAGNLTASAATDTTVSSGNATTLSSSGLVSISSVGSTKLTASTAELASAGDMTVTTTGAGDVHAYAAGTGNVLAEGRSVILSSTQNTSQFALHESGNVMLTTPGATATFSAETIGLNATGNASTQGSNVFVTASAAKLELLQSGQANLEADSGILLQPTVGDIRLQAPSGDVDVDCQVLDVQSTTSTIASTNTTLSSTNAINLRATQDLSMTGSATSNLHSTSTTRVFSDNKVDIKGDVELSAFAPKANVSAQNDLLMNSANVSISGDTYSTYFTGGHTSTSLDFTHNISRQANLVSEYKGFSFEALDSNNGHFDVHTAKRINLETNELNFLASNVNWGTEAIVATHANGFKIENTQGHMELKSANDVILGPSANLQISSDNVNITSVGAATFKSTQSDLTLDADAYINLAPSTATKSGMPLQFSSDANAQHILATNGALRLKGGDSESTVRIDGNLEVGGTLNYITTNSSSIQIEDKQVILGMSDVNDDNAADNAGLVVNGSAYESDAETLSLLWKKTDSAKASANDTAPFWKLSGGDLSISRVIPQAAWESPFHDTEAAGYQNSSQVVEYRWCITHDEKLQLIKLRGRKELGVNMAASGADKQVIAEFDM